MKKLMLMCLLSAGIAGLGMAGWAAEQKIATFNLRKAFDSYIHRRNCNIYLYRKYRYCFKCCQMASAEIRHSDKHCSSMG